MLVIICYNTTSWYSIFKHTAAPLKHKASSTVFGCHEGNVPSVRSYTNSSCSFKKKSLLNGNKYAELPSEREKCSPSLSVRNVSKPILSPVVFNNVISNVIPFDMREI